MSDKPMKILRYAWVVLFLWFGLSQMFFPNNWTAFLPTWSGYMPIPAAMLVKLNGWFEIFAAIFLFLGIFTRPIAIILTAHLLIIAASAGGAIGVRDFILAMIGVALASVPADNWTMDFKAKKTKTDPTPDGASIQT
ncbi:MAG: hypothetical protein A2538_01180 [Candidatus Magasanikbacteria bacterium RIFOXYD2_FULL_41_14]|uniref:DoxX family protein n=1 Tax=Candidatus Magasanikbacteria bacterium RIFOXYD2_FULL_41_14 TaxID=1798709 RepID=A0A1F6PE01_9BACT|nr:MAG: hypothetical protein A2538_01180 [Candidatus Magasanikbacteria bacterium RIFOXYD2_FULL_41_14]